MRALVLATCFLAACGAESPEQSSSTDSTLPATPVAIAPVLNGAWCSSAGGCTVEKSWDLREGAKNWSLIAKSDDHAIVEAQTRGDSLIGAGLVLAAGGGRQADATTKASLQQFARAVVGNCEGVDAYVSKSFTVKRSGVMDAPTHACGDWDVRSARIGIDFNISIDRRAP